MSNNDDGDDVEVGLSSCDELLQEYPLHFHQTIHPFETASPGPRRHDRTA